MPDEKWVKVAARSALAEGAMVGVEAGDLQIALYNVDGEIYATDNTCTHAFAMLTDGFLDGDIIECPLHGGRIEAKTGKGLGAPIPCDVKIYPVRLNGNSVQVDVT